MIGSLEESAVFSTICFSGSIIRLKCLSNAMSSSILPVFKARYFLRIESLVFAISFATFSRSLLSSMSTYRYQLITSRYCKVIKSFSISPNVTERHAADNILAEKARKRITASGGIASYTLTVSVIFDRRRNSSDIWQTV
ncbi:hypothetical protein ALC57_14654 [Trachymyrmex cornetzi]|uniref:Uncharacterized protein n=1 Tax=Trachymyrmex cornetzi TaxID=471704 RepID=A0A151IY40_9HYME|nr:hypothetical protein ALC57_14654 [Trachymyrmex cornetzi]